MTNISLRSYIREIEKLIDNSQADQALAHCRHILKSYPKCVDAYRLLGQAYLESQRYGDAADIFQRVLSSVPDDFVSHVGMSLIREDEGNLNQAIWHMERAFEVQPANAAIQGELRRLYGRRDGMEPPKIRLTRGALARMYARGELFQQAVAEIRNALAEDPNRLDLITLLASVYAQAGQKAEAVEMCNGLLRKLPYSLEGNRIMGEMLKDTDRVQDLQVYKRRLVALNPYFAQLSPAAPSVDRVPDQSVTVERLQWSPGMVVEGPTSQPEWAASLGVQLSGMTSEKDILPDWLMNLEESATEKGKSLPAGDAGKSASPFDSDSLMEFARETQKTEPSAEKNANVATKPLKPNAEEVIPEWMKDAGWEPSSGEAGEEESTISFGEEDDFLAVAAGESGLAEANIPQWLQAMAPSDAQDQAASAEGGDELAWLDGLQAEPPAAQAGTEGESEQAADWLSDSKVEVPDWLKELDEEKPANEVAPTKPLAEIPASEEPESEESLAEGALEKVNTSELQQSMPSEEPEGKESVPGWLVEGMRGPDARAAGPILTPQAQVEPAGESGEEIPDWLRDFVPEEETAPKGESEAMGQTPDWLQSLVPESEEVEHPAPEEISTPGEVEPEEAQAAEAVAPVEGPSTPVAAELPSEPEPEMQAGIAAEAELEPASEGESTAGLEAQPEEEAPAWDIEGADDAFAWLESLAVKQGADEALLLNPEERQETPPDWVRADLEEQTEASGQVPAEEAEIPDWLQELGPQGAEEGGLKEPEAELPDWIKVQPEAQVPEEQAIEPRAVEEAEVEAEPAEMPDWLQALEPQGSQTEETAPESQTVESEIPGWLSQAPETQEVEAPAEELQIEAEPQVEAEPAEIPDWLQALEPQGSELEKVEPELPAAESQVYTWPSAELEMPAPEIQGAEEAQEEELPGEAEPAEIPDWLQALEPKSSDELEEEQSGVEAVVKDESWFTEGPPILGDTHPVKVQSSTPLPAEELAAEPESEAEIPVMAETLAEETTQAVVETVPAEGETIAEAGLDEALAPAQAAQAVEAVEEQEPLPETLQEAEIEQLIPEESVEEPIAATDEWQPEELGTAPSEEVASMLSEMQESDEAFAWLESLAVRQGADEALILNPEQRSETPPEWVQAEIEEAEVEEIPSEEAVEMKPEALATEGQPSEWSLEGEPEEIEEERPAWTELEQAVAFEFTEAAEEISTEEEISPEEAIAMETEALVEEAQPTEVRAGEEIPELPDWLQESAAESSEDVAWTPPAVERPLEKLDLNRASLVELERLPDIGFRMAQNIVNYRDTFGAFKVVDDLLNIPGLGPEILADIQDWLYVTPPAEEIPAEPVAPLIGLEIEEGPAELTEARQYISEGELEQAAQSYTQIIKSNQHLETIIQDLQSATHFHPQAISLWQALGDAHLRAGQIQLALDAYNQAEKLLS